MRIPVDAARSYWAHPSQQIMGITPEALPDDGVEYWAEGDVCLGFHRAHWPDVWMVHIAVKPPAWGKTQAPVQRLLAAFWNDKQPLRIIAWVQDSNRSTLALARRCGFADDGAFPGVRMIGWRL